MSEQKQDESARGQLFSRLYLERGEDLTDSERFRVRLGAQFAEFVPQHARGQIAATIRTELGVVVPAGGSGPIFSSFFKEAEIRDVLDTITIVSQFLINTAQDRILPVWVSNVSRIFSEEGLSYSIDEKGGVHRAVDSEFDRNRVSVIRVLGSPRYRAVQDSLARAYEKLAQHERDGKGAVRDCFEAAETLAKIICDTHDKLDTGFVAKRLAPLANRVYGGDPATSSTAGRMVSSFADWVNAAHPFRHGHKTEVPTELPDDLAVLLISQGASFIRWLAGLDGQLRRT